MEDDDDDMIYLNNFHKIVERERSRAVAPIQVNKSQDKPRLMAKRPTNTTTATSLVTTPSTQSQCHP